MTTNHTPGPWVAHQESHGLFVSSGSFCIARLGDGLSEGQQENARLIAAAPELLSALVQLLEDETWAAEVNARAVIAKATGA